MPYGTRPGAEEEGTKTGEPSAISYSEGMRFGASRSLSVNIASVAHVKDGNHLTAVVYLVNHPVVAYPDAPSVTTCQLEATGRPGILGQAPNGVADSGIHLAGQCAQLFLSTP